MTRHLSTIVEARDENMEEFNNVDGTAQFGRGENRRRKINRRVHSCSDITLARDLNKTQSTVLTLPPLPTRTTTERQALYGNGKRSRENLYLSSCSDIIFPDFRPPDPNCSILDFDAKVGRHLTQTKSNADDSFSHNKENIVASWLQFFG